MNIRMKLQCATRKKRKGYTNEIAPEKACSFVHT